MSKKNFIERLKDNDVVIENETQMYDAFMGVISEMLKNGEEVTLNGIGKLTVVKRAERAGVNPKTSEKITIPARNAVTFKASKTIKESIN